MNSPFFRDLRRGRLREAVTLMLLTGLMLQSATAVAPDWWTTQGVINTQKQADDYAVANLGQLKSIAKKAAQAMEASLPGGAGDAVTAMLAGWSSASAAGITRDDYAAINLGQLKTVAKPFYDRLIAAGARASNTYPWSGASSDDYALANIGQLKTAFAFPISGGGSTGGGGSSDSLGGPDDDYDHDGLTNAQELALGTDPRSWDSDGDGVPDGIEMIEGTDPHDPSSSSAILIALTFRSHVE